METKKKSIELRSEKVRNIVGQIPSLLIRQGVIVIGMALLILVGIAAMIPYRKIIPVKVTMHTVPRKEIVYAAHAGILVMDSLLFQVNMVASNATKFIKVDAGQRIGVLYRGDSIPQKHTMYGTCMLDDELAKKMHLGQHVFVYLSSGIVLVFELNRMLEDNGQYSMWYLQLQDSNSLDILQNGQSYAAELLEEEKSILSWMTKGM